MPKKPEPTGVGADRADFIKDLEAKAYCHAKRGRKPKAKPAPPEVTPITHADQLAQAEMRQPNRAPRIGGREVLPRERVEADYARIQPAPRSTPMPTTPPTRSLSWEEYRAKYPREAARDGYGGGPRERTPGQLENDQRMSQQAKMERHHKLIQRGARLFACLCGMTYTNAGGSRSVAEGAHQRHQAEVKRMWDEREAQGMPDCLA